MKKKVNDFKGFYEDEESLKMMSIVREASKKEQKVKQDKIKKQNRKDLLINILVSIALIIFVVLVGILIIKLFQYNARITENFMNSCQAKGYSYNYCVAHS